MCGLAGVVEPGLGCVCFLLALSLLGLTRPRCRRRLFFFFLCSSFLLLSFLIDPCACVVVCMYVCMYRGGCLVASPTLAACLGHANSNSGRLAYSRPIRLIRARLSMQPHLIRRLHKPNLYPPPLQTRPSTSKTAWQTEHGTYYYSTATIIARRKGGPSAQSRPGARMLTSCYVTPTPAHTQHPREP